MKTKKELIKEINEVVEIAKAINSNWETIYYLMKKKEIIYCLFSLFTFIIGLCIGGLIR